MKNEALERYTATYKKRNAFREQHAQIFNEFEKIYDAIMNDEADLKDECIRAGHDLENGVVHVKFIAGSTDGKIRPRAQVSIIR